MGVAQAKAVSIGDEATRVIHFPLPFREHGFGVFQVDDYDIIAAKSQDEAVKWFLDNWDVVPEELYAQPKEIRLDDTLNYMDTPDSHIRTISYRQLVKEAIRDRLKFPCIIATYDW